MLKKNYYYGLFVVALCATAPSYGMDYWNGIQDILTNDAVMRVLENGARVIGDGVQADPRARHRDLGVNFQCFQHRSLLQFGKEDFSGIDLNAA